MTEQTGAIEVGLPLERRKSTGLWSDAFRRLLRNRLAIVGGIFVIFLLFVAVFGPQLAPWPYYEQHLQEVIANGNRPLVPMQQIEGVDHVHYLGTDQLGRDLLSRLMDGARISMMVALVAQFVVIVIGIPVGAMAAWFGGKLDNFLMRITDIVYAYPDLLFIILLGVAFRETFFGRAMDGLLLVFVAIGLTSWVTMARLVRGQLLSLKEQEFVEAARAIGVSDRKIVNKHLLPNATGPIIVAVTLGIPAAILAEATLAFIGIGVQDPRASWGSLVADGQTYVRSFPHMVLYPAIAIAVALISFTFLGDGLRDALDPKLKGKQ
ncbi:MAG TPA: ABC transporter permease [Candidatus Limnocylindria bacterium]|nr:ABC transporter permease [Candidatus Limnocylindria bacterium]